MRKISSRRGGYLSLILTFLMIFSSFADTGLVLKSYAADDEVIPEAVSENETEEIVSEDEMAEETAVEAAAEETVSGDSAGEEDIPAADDEQPAKDEEPAEEAPIAAEGEKCGDDLNYTLTDGVLTISGSGDMYDYENPTSSSSGTRKVPWADDLANIKGLVLPEGLTSIGAYSFYKTTSLSQNLVLPEGLTKIGTRAFEQSAIEGDLTIPARVTDLGEGAFDDCQKLTGELIIRSGGITIIPKYAFYRCPFTKVTLPSTLQEIRSYAFSYLSPTTQSQRVEVVIPELVNRIDDYAFDDSKAIFYFKGNVPAYSLYDPYNTLWGVNHPLGYNNSDTGKIFYIDGNSGWIPAEGYLGGYTFASVSADNEHFTTANDGETLPAVSDSGSCGTDLTWKISGTMAGLTLTIEGSGKMNDFREKEAPWQKYMPAITTLVLPEGLTSIGAYAFQKSYALKGGLTIPSTVTSIGARAFDQSGFYNTKLTIPASVKTIGDYAFYRCRGIRGIELNEGLTSIGQYAFQYCCGLNGSLTIPSSLETLSDYAFSECRNLNGNLVMRSGLEAIGRYAFQKAAIQDVTLPSTLLIIKQGAFSQCDSVQKFVVPALVYDLGASAFAPSTSGGVLTDVYFKGNAPFERDGSGADDWKSYLGDVSKVKVHNIKGTSGWSNPWSGYTTVKHNSADADFADENEGESLEAVDDGGKIGSKLNWAVSGTPDDLTLTISGSGNMNSIAKAADAPWHEYRHKIRHLVLSDTMTTISDYAFSDFTAVQGDLVIPEGVTTIGKYAYSNTGFGNETLTIPANVKTISDYAFQYNTRMSYLEIESGLEYIGQRAFLRCSGFKGDLEIPESVENIGEYAFATCQGFSGTLTLNANITSLSNGVFQRCPFIEVILPQTLTEINAYAFSYNDVTTKITIPPLVDYVASSAFVYDNYSKASPRSVYFEGNAPTNSKDPTFAESSLSQAFGNNTKVTLYYIDGKEGWTTPTWHDYPTRTWEGPATVAVTGVELSPSVAELEVGSTKQLSVKVLPANATDKSVSYSSNNETVATVSVTGLVTAVASGNAVITVTTTDGKKTANCEVTVKEKKVEPAVISVNGVSVSPNTVTIKVGETAQLSAFVTPADATDPSVSWKSGDTSVATVSKTGLVTAVASGNAVITVTTNDGGFTADCSVKVEEKSQEKPEKNKYTVEFYWDNEKDETVLLDTQVIKDGDTVDFPDVPEKEGFAFAGWCVDGEDGRSWDETMPVHQDLDLHARFVGEESRRHSGMDPDLVIEEETDLYMVKGQKFNFPVEKKWSSEDSVIVAISNDYKSVAKKVGRTVITGTDGTEEGTVTYNVYVTDPKLVIAAPEAQKGAKVLKLVEGNKGTLELDGMMVERPKEEGEDKAVTEDASDEYEITWVTSNKEVVLVDDGEVYAVAKGSAKITAYICGKTYSFPVKVTDIYGYGAGDEMAGLELTPLQSVKLKVKKSDFNLSAKSVWSSLDETLQPVKNEKNGKIMYYQNDVVRVTAAGKITAIGAGTVDLVVEETEGSSRKKEFTVSVADTVTKTVYINKGKSRNIKFYGMKFTGSNPAQGSIQVDTSKYEARMIEFAKKQSTIKAHSTGKAKVIYRYDPFGTGGFDYVVNVYVEDPKLATGKKLTHKSGSKYTLELKEGETFVLQMEDVYQNVTYTSSKKNVAFVDEMGVIEARSAGSKGKAKSTISAKVNGTKITVEVTVTK